jgi:hypothetical protein
MMLIVPAILAHALATAGDAADYNARGTSVRRGLGQA